jgi:hypothetical protein
MEEPGGLHHGSRSRLQSDSLADQVNNLAATLKWLSSAPAIPMLKLKSLNVTTSLGLISAAYLGLATQQKETVAPHGHGDRISNGPNRHRFAAVD